MRTLCLCLLIAVPAAADEKPQADSVVPMAYKKTPQVELKMHVHFPEGWKPTDKRPAIVFFFGGGWTNGKVTQFESQAEHFADRGLVCARADYRVKSRHGIGPKECVEDAKSAVRYLRANAGDLGIDPERIVASGGSAGGHIAACTALSGAFDPTTEIFDVSPKPNALLLYNPVLRFAGVPAMLKRLDGDEELAKKISPVLYVGKGMPPTLMFFGTSDRLIEQGDEFLKRAKEVGAKVEMHRTEGQPHGFFNRPPHLQATTRAAEEFLRSLGYLEGGPKK